MELLGYTLIALGVVAVVYLVGMRRRRRDSSLKPIADAYRATQNAPATPNDLEEAKRDEAQHRIFLRPIGFVARLVFYATILVGAYFYFGPKDLSERTLGQLTVGEIGGNIVFVAFILIWGRALFNPIDTDVMKDAWGKIGIAMLCLGVVGWFLFRR